jgi:hypothetical protein
LRLLIALMVAGLATMTVASPAAANDTEPLTLAILVAAHDAYVPGFDNDPDVVGAQKRGYQKLIDGLHPEDRVGVWSYDENGINPPSSPSRYPAQAENWPLLQSEACHSRQRPAL